jgi:aldehyde:ferredoxin oxidoreductase
MHGWSGKVLHVDLSAASWRVEEPPREVLRAFIGGKGLAGWYLRERATLPFDDPNMPLLVFSGPLGGTVAPTSGRATLMSRSALTNAIGDCSVGGGLGTELRRAGWDGLVITGRAHVPCGIEIENGSVTLIEARVLAGLGAEEVFRRLAGKGSVACVGPAAENGVLFSSVLVDRRHAAGRTGLGCGFAAKNLKYLMVHGTGRVRVHDPGLLKAAREEIMRLTAASPALLGPLGFAEFGTAALVDLMDSRRMTPTDNFRATKFPGASRVNAYAFRERYRPKRHGCRGCHILCKKIAADGRSVPEFETVSHFSALIGQADPELVMRANALCNDLGLDTISAASTLACHREVEGRDLSAPEVLSLIEDMGRGRGAGRALGRGAARYAASRGRPEAAMTVKGLELPAYDPRGAYGMALAYATSTRGGCHLRAYPVSHEILRKPVATDRFSFEGKARIVKIAEDMNAVVDSLPACKFTFFAASLEEYAKAYSAVTGEASSAQDLLLAGERISYHERMMNAANGFSAAEDDLPARFFAEAGTGGGGVEVPAVPRADFLAARSAYYRVRGLDENGLPRRETAERLGLTWIG